MSLKPLPELCALEPLNEDATFDIRPEAIERWSPMADVSTDASTISIFDRIGESPDGQGVTAKRISAALRSIGQRDLTVQINSPGGNFFEGVAIYNLLRNHRAKVAVDVIGIAASAASIIAMAGDEIKMGHGSSLMIHNSEVVAMGNRHDFADISSRLASIDTVMAQFYANRTGIPLAEIAALMDQETYFGPGEAVERGFADGLLADSNRQLQSGAVSRERKALACVEAALAKAGYTRSQRRDTLKTFFSSTPSAAESKTTPSASPVVIDQLHQLINTLTH